MPFKLFHKKEEVTTDDSIKEKMYTGITPLGRDIRALVELDPTSHDDKFIMANYDDVKMDESPLEELMQLKQVLQEKNVKLALCKGSAVFFADLNELIRYKDIILREILPHEQRHDTGLS